MVRSVILCVSLHHGNTRKVAEAISRVLNAEILRPEDADPKELVESYELMGFGSGIYYGKPHRSLLEFAERLSKKVGAATFIFSTSGIPRIPIFHDYHKPLVKILREKGFRILGEFTCRGFNTHGVLRKLGGMNRGRPSSSDLEKARKFAESLLAKLRAEISLNEPSQMSL